MQQQQQQQQLQSNEIEYLKRWSAQQDQLEEERAAAEEKTKELAKTPSH